MNYRKTVRACYMSYVSHAVLNNLPNLLFVLLSAQYGLRLEQLGRLVLINFATRFIIDSLAIRLADKVGYRTCLVSAHVIAALGLVMFGTLPQVLPAQHVYLGLCLTMILFSVGGGLVQVLVSPIVNEISGHLGAGSMLLLHSFYPWGVVFTILCTTIALRLTPEGLWYVIPIVWVMIPLVTAYAYATAPMAEPRMRESGTQKLGELRRSRGFWLFIGMMVFCGMTEAGMSQWSSFFADEGLGISKIVGDLLGPCLKAVIMATVRMTYGKWEHRFPLERLLPFAAFGSALCFAGMALIPNPALALAASTFSGFTIAMMWPGTVHRGAARFPRGGTALFGMMALGGDMGAASGPWALGVAGDRVKAMIEAGARLPKNLWILTGSLFPLGFLALFLIDRKRNRDAFYYLNKNNTEQESLERALS